MAAIKTKETAELIEWLEGRYPIDFEEGVDEAHDEMMLGDAQDVGFAYQRMMQRWNTHMVRNAAYWAGYGSAVEIGLG